MRTIVNKWNLSAKKRLACLAAVLICAALCACAGDAGQKKKHGDWSAKQGITVTPQGDCQVELRGYDVVSNENTGDFIADVNVTISETTVDVTEGYKKVTAAFDIDVSNCTGGGVLYWCSAFDRYTGTSFEFDSAVNQQLDTPAAQEGFVTIQDGDETYDVSVEFMAEGKGGHINQTITVTCPTDYEGAMFQLGKASLEQLAKNAEIDYASRLYTIDELPFMGDGYRYFTMANN